MAFEGPALKSMVLLKSPSNGLEKVSYKLCSPTRDKVVHPATDKQLYLEI